MAWSKNQQDKALKALAQRKIIAAKEGRIDNSSLYAGAPMYYYCRVCGLLSDALPESHSYPPRHLCDDCHEMISNGYSTAIHKFVQY
jgi:hypothetical protein